jgi:dihydrofolate synthase/folylpolyglutamate synthase
MRYTEAVQYLYSLGNEVLTAKLGLQNIAALLQFLGDPQRKFKSVLIAGTNGKGSVAACTESVLRTAGWKTGLYTSPHLSQIEERIRVKGTMISAEDFARLTQVVKAAVADLQKPLRRDSVQPSLDRHPTYFEMVTAIAFEYFAEQRIDVGVLEVGLGGRLDATNTVDPLVAVITNVDLDHQRYLGTRLEEIAFEKAGIIKPIACSGGSPLWVICGSDHPVVRAVVESHCELAGARLVHALDDVFHAEPDEYGRFLLQLNPVFGQRLEVRIPLPGEHQVRNTVTAIRALEALHSSGVPVDPQSIKEGIETTRWPGRLEVVECEPTIILDGAHNAAGAECVRQYCERFLRGRRLSVIFGALQDKAIVEMGLTLFPLSEEIVLTSLQSERGADPFAIAELLPQFRSHYRFASTAEEALLLARQKVGCDGVILVVGSLFLVGEIQRALRSVAMVQ